MQFVDNNPLITVAIPVFNGEDYIKAAIDSVLAQTYQNFELLIVDNASEDKTEDIARSFSDRRLVYIRNETNLGAAQNWNKCLDFAKGEYIKILPHDDVLKHNCLMEQISCFQEYKNQLISMVFSSRRIINEKGRVVANRRYPFARSGKLAAYKIKKDCLIHGTNLLGEPGAVLFRMEAAKKVGYFNERYPYVIDLDYWFRLLSCGDAVYQDKLLSDFRLSGRSWSQAIGWKQRADFFDFISNPLMGLTQEYPRIYFWIANITSGANMFLRRLFYFFS